MSSNISFLFNTAVLSLILLIIGRMQNGLDRLWVTKHTVLIAAAGLAYWFEVPDAGYILFGLSCIFVILPLLCVIAARRLNERGSLFSNYAHKLFTILHPSGTAQYDAKLTQALAEKDRATQYRMLEALEQGDGFNAYIARLYRLRYMNLWEEILALPFPSDDYRYAKPIYGLFYLQALGQTNQVDRMFTWYREHKAVLEGTPMQEPALMALLIFSGAYVELEDFRTASHMMIPDEDWHWSVSFTKLKAGHENERSVLHALAEDVHDPIRKKLMLQSINRGSTVSATPGDREFLTHELAAFVTDKKLPRKSAPTIPVVLSLIIANLIMFGLEFMQGAPDDIKTLVELGGLWPPYVFDGEWWRLGSALFLHLSWFHIGFNMMALYLIGEELERWIGSLKTLVVYLGGGLLSSFFALWMMEFGYARMAVLVGASGAVFALLGALSVYVLADWIVKRRADKKRQLFAITLVILAQTAMDFVATDVSFSGHLGGFVAGALIGAIFILFKR
ncbi:rhomboid family intramembrane serine protease [Microvirga sp. W0021]|uniref:Rhomboid family intramembrane serine protease n=1 Tax=Hohaiivirga grylli TaxID=3133970 RepID=A0ABV0BFK2_9HYPH